MDFKFELDQVTIQAILTVLQFYFEMTFAAGLSGRTAHDVHLPGGVGGEFHAGEGADGLVREVERVERRRVEDVGDDLVAHEDVLEQVLEGAVGATGARVLQQQEHFPWSTYPR